MLDVGRGAARIPALLLAVIAATWVAAPAAAQQPPTAGPAPPAPSARVFGSDAGIILNPVKPTATANFEAVMLKLKEALAKSKDPARQQQARSWRIFRAQEPGIDGAVLYVFIMDPAVKGADYSLTKALAEAFPTEVQALYDSYSAALAGPASLINLTLVDEKAPGAMVELQRLRGR